jgi:cellulose synthase/poly-beta-1,6-N-acetylglucosamine synthase-like glycosyltransferase
MLYVNGSVSVVIPNKNRATLVVEAVQSALDASPPPLEVIVVDSGSTDGSIQKLAAFGDRITVVSRELSNAAATRNAGAAMARGDYLGFLDSDDVMLSDKLSCLGAALDRDDRLGLVHGRTIVVDERGQVDHHGTAEQELAFRRGAEIGTSFDGLALYCAMFTSATLIRRRAFEDLGGYDETLDVYEDWDLYLRLSLRWRLGYEQCPTARYRVWPGNVSWQRTARGVIQVAEKHLANLPQLSPDAARMARYGLLRRLAEANHILLRPSETRRAAIAAARLRPLTAVADPQVRGPLFGSFLPASLLRRRRPRTAVDEPST